MDTVKLTPAVKDYIWGGTKLKGYGKSGEKIAETWELSFHKDGLCLVDGTPLADLCKKSDLGENANSFGFFPMLIKFIDARDNLSVQVHPSDAYSLKNENQLGKTEMWYILEAEEGAGLYLGFKEDVTPEQFAAAIENDTVTELLNFVPVKAGEHYFIKSGTVHAIGKGVTLCEVQQNSNVTYRVYDFGRVGVDGKPRQLHVEKAKAVSNLKGGKPLSPSVSLEETGRRIISVCKYFTVYEWTVSGKLKMEADENSFNALCCVKGSGKVGNIEVKVGDTVFVPAGKEETVEGDMTLLSSSVRKLLAYSQPSGKGFYTYITDDFGEVIVEREAPAVNGFEAVREAAAEVGLDMDDLGVAMITNY